MEFGFCQVNWNLLQYKDYKNILLFPAGVFYYIVLFDKKLIVFPHVADAFLFYFHISIKLTFLAVILPMEK